MDELKKYVQKTTKDKLILGIFAIIFAAVAVVAFTRHTWVLFAVMLLCAFALFTGALTSTSTDKKFFDSIENSPEKYAILSDFETAQSCANDNLRMGSKYIFTKKYPRLISYEDIVMLQYFEHHSTDTGRTEPAIAYTLADGKGATLCSLYGNDTDMQVQEIYDIILSRNPNVEIKPYQGL